MYMIIIYINNVWDLSIIKLREIIEVQSRNRRQNLNP